MNDVAALERCYLIQRSRKGRYTTTRCVAVATNSRRIEEKKVVKVFTFNEMNG